MSSLIFHGAVLTISCVSNYAVILVGALLLVRILAVPAFNQYREFMLSAIVPITLAGFTVEYSLPYFLAKSPGQHPKYAAVASLLISYATLIVVSATFTFLRAAYVFCVVNLNSIKRYWMTEGQADRVLNYSVDRTPARVTVLLAVAISSKTAAQPSRISSSWKPSGSWSRPSSCNALSTTFRWGSGKAMIVSSSLPDSLRSWRISAQT